jgi:hypothetical protein
MEKPNINLNELSFGKIFQISPEGLDPTQVSFAGDFLVSTEYSEHGVYGYLASVYERSQVPRTHGLAYMQIEWKYLECVGAVEWLRQNKKEEENGESSDNKS